MRDSYLDPPDDQDEVVVSGCAACKEDLMAGEAVIEDLIHEVYFCHMGCAGNFVKKNPEMYPEGLEDADLKVKTLEAPEPDDGSWG